MERDSTVFVDAAAVRFLESHPLCVIELDAHSALMVVGSYRFGGGWWCDDPADPWKHLQNAEQTDRQTDRPRHKDACRVLTILVKYELFSYTQIKTWG